MWVDSLVNADLPDPETDSTLFELVKTYKIYRQRKSCRKFKEDKYRFLFECFFTNRTIIAQPLSSSLSSLEKK